jgi:hypothetical protein
VKGYVQNCTDWKTCPFFHPSGAFAVIRLMAIRFEDFVKWRASGIPVHTGFHRARVPHVEQCGAKMNAVVYDK